MAKIEILPMVLLVSGLFGFIILPEWILILSTSIGKYKLLIKVFPDILLMNWGKLLSTFISILLL